MREVREACSLVTARGCVTRGHARESVTGKRDHAEREKKRDGVQAELEMASLPSNLLRSALSHWMSALKPSARGATPRAGANVSDQATSQVTDE